ncbi:MAG: hypothetical protein ACKVVT_02145 [Dehalococcoidia bacterium]
MNTPHPVLGRHVASYGINPLRHGAWWLPLPVAAAAGGAFAGIMSADPTQALAIWGGTVAIALFWVVYRWRALSMQCPLIIYDRGFLWSDGGDHAEVLFGEVMAMTPELRRPLPFLKGDNWWVIETDDEVAFTIGPSLRDQVHAMEWIVSRVAETVPEPVRRPSSRPGYAA